MQHVEEQLREDSYGGLNVREARLKERHDLYVGRKEADELLAVARKKLAERELVEAASGGANPANPPELETPEVIRKELGDIASNLPHFAALTAVGATAQVVIEVTQFRRLTAKLQFPQEYPTAPLKVHLQSSTLSFGLVEKLETSANAAARETKGHPHAAVPINLLLKLLKSNRLAPAYDDLVQIRELFSQTKNITEIRGDTRASAATSERSSLVAGTDSLDTECTIAHAKQVSGEVVMVLRVGAYRLHVKAVVPEQYPAEPLDIKITDCNLPETLVRHQAAKVSDMANKLAQYAMPSSDVNAAATRSGAGQAATSKAETLARDGKQTVVSFRKGQHLAEAARERAEATRLRREAEESSFVARPSLFPIAQHLYSGFLFPLAAGKCRVCCKRLLPADPNKLQKVPADMQVLQLYCGHSYHFKCVESYVSEPPFGKACHTCGAAIEHRAITTDIKVLEARWAAKQAKKRELDEIVDFMM